jgi:hypothetical protein
MSATFLVMKRLIHKTKQIYVYYETTKNKKTGYKS